MKEVKVRCNKHALSATPAQLELVAPEALGPGLAVGFRSPRPGTVREKVAVRVPLWRRHTDKRSCDGQVRARISDLEMERAGKSNWLTYYDGR